MQSFKEWLDCHKSPLVSEGANIAPKLKKPSRKKRVSRPNNAIDGFVREMELLKKDLSALGDKKRRDRATTATKQSDDKKPQKPVKQEINDDLMKTAKIVLSNLKNAPNYYTRRDHIDRLAGLDRQPNMKKVSRQDVKHVAKELGIDFGSVNFTPEAFRRGVEAEITHPTPSDKPVVPTRGDQLAQDREPNNRPVVVPGIPGVNL